MAKADTKTTEKLYVVNLRNGFMNSPIGKRGRVAMKYLKKYFETNLKREATEVKISQGINHEILKHGIKKPPGRVKVKVAISGDTANVMLPDEKAQKKKKIRKITRPTDAKTKLQEMLAQKTAAVSDSKEKKESETKKPEEKPATEKKEIVEKKFENQIAADKKPAGKK